MRERSRDIEDQSRDIEDQSRDTEDQSRDIEDQSRDTEDQSRDIEDQSRDIEDQSRDIEDQSRDTEDQSRDTDGDNVTNDNCFAEHYCSTSLANFPTELLVMILLYLPMRDRFMMRNVSQRFRDVYSEMPSVLWKECLWDYGPRHVSRVSELLIEHGKHVKRIFFPAHLTVKVVLELASHCTQVTHLSLPRDTQLTLDGLEKVVRTMTCLHQLQLGMFAEGNVMQKYESLTPWCDRWNIKPWYWNIKEFLKITANCVKELNLRVTQSRLASIVKNSIKELASQGYTLPIINIFGDGTVDNLSSLWVELQESKYESSSFEIGLYDYRKIPMNLYPLIPLKKLKFGPSVTSPFIQLSSYGIEGIQHDIFWLSEYNCFGTVRYILTPVHKLYHHQNIPISYDQMDFVSCVDFSNVGVNSNHLEQLAVLCPNLQRLNLQGNVDCLEHLQGLRAIVHTCQNLEGINLTKISKSRVESRVLLWKLLSRLKKLTHLAIDLCLTKAYSANRQKLIINMFKACQCLKALEITCNCRRCNSVEDFFFSYFPSLTYCRMLYCSRSALSYAISNCHKLKYFYGNCNADDFDDDDCDDDDCDDVCKESILPLSNNCYLEQLCINSLSLNLTDELVEVLSANGQLERVVLYVNSITINGITTLINNSPKLTLLHICMMNSCFDDGIYFKLRRLLHASTPFVEPISLSYNYEKIDRQYTDRVKNMFPYRELFPGSNVSVRVRLHRMIQDEVIQDEEFAHHGQEMLNFDLVDTDLNSLWPSLKPDEF